MFQTLELRTAPGRHASVRDMGGGLINTSPDKVSKALDVG